MPNYRYDCKRCGEQDVFKSMAKSGDPEKCEFCGKKMQRMFTVPSLKGTRDSFGIKNAFIDPESGKEITTWPEWEKAGYKQLKDTTPTKRRRKCNEKIKEKRDKLKHKLTI